jgi:transcription antitermination factor NusG
MVAKTTKDTKVNFALNDHRRGRRSIEQRGNSAMGFWTVVQTETRREFVAAEHLKRGGYEIYVPRIAEIRCNGVTRIYPLFPSYIFANIDLVNWTAIRWTVAVVRVLMNADQQPAKLPETVMNDLLERGDKTGLIQIPVKSWIAGETRLRIVRGSFRDFEAIYQSSARDRVNVLLALMGQQINVELPRQDVVLLENV